MKKNKDKIPKWLNSVLQSLTYWIGYKSQYSRFLLNEGSLIGEITQLLSSILSDKFMYIPEIQYKYIVPKASEIGDIRADLVILKKTISKTNIIENTPHKFSINEKITKYTSVVFEVKNYRSGSKLILHDIDRLKIIKNQVPKIKCYLIVVSQNNFPKDFVTDNAYSKGTIQYHDREIRIPRICKATASFNLKKKENAHYACLIEIL